MPQKQPRERLVEKLAKLDDDTCQILETLVDMLERPFEEEISPSTDIVTPKFAKNFRTRLQFHHANHEEVFKKKTFEFAFKAASIAAGHKSDMEVNPTNPGYDVVVDKTRYSLKTEAEVSISERHIKISKFMEARWIRECRNGCDFHKGFQAVVRHLEHYDRVLILRAFRVTEPFRAVRYDLYEIPHTILKAMAKIKPEDFTARRDSGTSTATVQVNGGIAFKIRLDGSVEKVTIDRLDVSLCCFHARWKIPTPISAEAEDD